MGFGVGFLIVGMLDFWKCFGIFGVVGFLGN